MIAKNEVEELVFLIFLFIAIKLFELDLRKNSRKFEREIYSRKVRNRSHGVLYEKK